MDEQPSILMISVIDVGTTASAGVAKKLLGQFRAFQRLGSSTALLCLDQGRGVLLHRDGKEILFPRQKKTYFAYIRLFALAERICKERQIQLCYIRYPLADWVFCRMIRKLHSLCKVCVEIPTFPYDYDTKKERNIVSRVNYWQDRRNRDRMRHYVDLSVNFNGYDQIYGIPSLPIHNGIDVDSVHYVGDQISFGGELNLIGVAQIVQIHGYDRVIEGLRNYYGREEAPTRNVNFYIVGDGPEAPRLRQLVHEYGLEEHVFFTGIRTGEELDALFARCSIAVASLGIHRRGGGLSSELKIREYCARGTPFIGSSRDEAVPDEAEFRLLLPACDEPVEMAQVVEFADRCGRTPGLCPAMRRFAQEHFSWENQLRTVLERMEVLPR